MAKSIYDQPSKGTTAVVAGFLFLITLSGLQMFSAKLASTPQFHILGGLVSSFLFIFGLLFIGNLEKETGWIEVISSILVAMVFAASVHRVCVTTCFLFSIGELFYLNFISKRINTVVASVNVSSPPLKRVRSSERF